MSSKFHKSEVKPAKRPDPRSKDDILKEYARLAQEVGDAELKVRMMKRNADYKVDQLMNELNSREQLDKKETKDEPAQTVNNQEVGERQPTEVKPDGN